MGAAHLLSAAVALAVWAAGCATQCKDHDGDGRGPGCAAGPDCDDNNPKLAARCDAVAQRCQNAPYEPGCPCLRAARHACYSAAQETAAVGPCHGGTQRCTDGAWSECVDEVTPKPERCNGDDDDCDGRVDEGVLSPCGGCNPACTGGVWGTPNAPFEAQGELDVTPLGELTLRLHELESLTVWVPNTGDGTLSKVDAVTARELSRYRVAGDTPERIAIDYRGDAWVLSPSLDAVSMLTKVASDLERCVDRNGDGLLQTSQGPDDVLAESEDECVVLSAPVGEAGEVARALATDGGRGPDGAGGGNLWVGLEKKQSLLELDGQSAAVLREVPTPGLAPYAAAFDPWGTLWVIDRDGVLGRVRPAAVPDDVAVIEAPLACYLFEALASDQHGVLTLTGSACEQVALYDPTHDLWQHAQTDDLLDTRGVAMLGDEAWVSHTGGSISRVRRAPLAIDDAILLGRNGFAPVESIAVGADSHGQLWVVSSMGSPQGHGVLTRVDPMRGEVTAQVPLGRLPRGQGDITGNRRLGEFAREASTTHIFDGCSGPLGDAGTNVPVRTTDWQKLHLAAVSGEGGSVLVEARQAASRSELTTAAWTVLGESPKNDSPFDVPFDNGGVIEVRLTLRVSGRIGAPRIARVGLEWQCAGPE